MRKRTHLLLATLVTATMLQAPPAVAFESYREDPNAVPVLVDVTILRPFGFGMTVLGFLRFSALAPFIAITRPTDIEKVFRSLVIHPARYTWVDPLGYHPDREAADYGEIVP